MYGEKKKNPDIWGGFGMTNLRCKICSLTDYPATKVDTKSVMSEFENAPPLFTLTSGLHMAIVEDTRNRVAIRTTVKTRLSPDPSMKSYDWPLLRQ